MQVQGKTTYLEMLSSVDPSSSSPTNSKSSAN